VLRALVIALVLAVGAVPAAIADEPLPPPPEPVPVTVVPEGVTISGVAVGGMTAEEATATVQAWFDQPVRFQFKKKRWRASPIDLGARPYVDGAVKRALAAAPGSALELVVAVSGRQVRAYVRSLDEVFSRPPKDSTVRLKGLRPYVTKAREGVRVLLNPMTAAIVRALRSNARGPIPLEARLLEPKVTIASFGPIIVIRRESKKLYLYRGMRYWTRFAIVVKQRDPWWYPPASPWADGEKPVPPGPGNPLGTRWMGLSAPLVGIHGTPDAASIGYSASHGCIRMRIPDAEWLFDHVDIGTTVFIVRA
jgi:hypothetical protein